jgi:tetratricopeptide (TPR) repeat protein
MRPSLDFLLLDGFDPETGALALRVAITQISPEDPRFLRLRLHLGRRGDPLQPLRRELESHLRLPLPELWESGLKLIIHAVEEDLAQPNGRDPALHLWVQTQVMHPSDERRSTINHSLPEQAQIVFDWSQKLELNGEPARAAELLERMLLLSPGNTEALKRLSALLRELGMIEESLDITEQWSKLAPSEPESFVRHAEALLYLEKPKEALKVFQDLLLTNPMHPMAHIGAAQAKGFLGGDPYPHLDAALELNSPLTISVLKETFDYRAISHSIFEKVYPLSELPELLGVSLAELKTFMEKHQMPLNPNDGSIHESALSRWVGIQNRYNLLPSPLHWSAPTPRKLPEIE